jgi:hypothetical protein
LNWAKLISVASKEKIRTYPVTAPWWKKFHAKLVVNASFNNDQRTFRRELFNLRSNVMCNPDIECKKTRVEGNTISFFFENAEQTAGVLDFILTLPDCENYVATELHCPINDQHVEIMNAEFPTQVREKLFQGEYRYRIVANIPWGQCKDPVRVKRMMLDWLEWESMGQGEISKAASSRFREMEYGKADYYASPGIMSFYTNDQQLSFIMKLSYPDFYRNTEKAVTLSEIEGVANVPTSAKTFTIPTLGTGDLVSE